MLRPARRLAGGFSMIELMVVVTLIAFLAVLAVPAFGKWTADAHVRAAAEALTNAIRLTQSTAIAKGRTGVFVLTAAKSPAYNSTPAAAGPNWFAELNPLGGSDETAASLGLFMKSTEGTQHGVTITNAPALICFSALGRQTNLSATQTSIGTACSTGADDTHPTTYTVSKTGATRSFNVLVYLGGRVRMCDAAKTLSSSNPDGC